MLSLPFCGYPQGYPIVHYNQGWLLGFVAGGNYYAPDSMTERIPGVMTYQLYSIEGFVGTAKAAAPEKQDYPCENIYAVDIETDTLITDEIIALGADFDAHPRPVKKALTGIQTYNDITAALLRDYGLRDPYVNIDEGYVADLDDDGQDDIIICATHYESGLASSATAGDYSVVFVRKKHGDHAVNIVLESDIHLFDVSFGAPLKYQVAGILDLDGDGEYEIIITEDYYEGSATLVYTISGDSAIRVLSAGCGL